MAIGRTNAGGGGAGLNFKVVGDTSAPSNPSENTIWVNTDAAITSWAFSSTEPNEHENGMVWFKISNSSEAPFNALKKNVIQVFPVDCQQYVGDAWVKKTAKTYQGGKWVDWIVYLFDGTVNEALTGGINGTIANGVISFSGNSMQSTNKTYSTKNPVDLTNFSKMCAKVTSGGTVKGPYFRLAVLNSASNGGEITKEKTVANVYSDAPFNNEVRTVELDISGLSGSYYLSHAGGVYSSGGNKNFDYTIYEWWLE